MLDVTVSARAALLRQSFSRGVVLPYFTIFLGSMGKPALQLVLIVLRTRCATSESRNGGERASLKRMLTKRAFVTNRRTIGATQERPSGDHS